MDDSGFLDLLYGAAADTSQWVPVLERLADLTGGNSAWVSRLNLANGTGSGVLARLDPAFSPLYLDYYAGLNPFSNPANPQTFVSGWTPKITTDEDWVAKDDLVGSEYYNDFLAPQEVHSFAMVRLARHDLDECAITIHRSKAAGAFERRELETARRLHPHLIRAFRLTEQLAHSGLTTDETTAALDHSPYGVFVLNAAGAIQRVNRMGERLLAGGVGLSAVHGRLAASQAAAARQLQALIGAAGSADPALRRGGSMTLAAPGRRAPLSITVAPIRSDRLAVFGYRPSVIVCVTDPEAHGRISEERVRSLFGFTGAEARVALAILDGATAREAAERLGVSFHTVRHQLQSMLDKTGAGRQSELVAMILRAGGPQLH